MLCSSVTTPGNCGPEEKKSISGSNYHTPVVLTVNILYVWAAAAHRKSVPSLALRTAVAFNAGHRSLQVVLNELDVNVRDNKFK